ncbi:hypothetical protein ABT288_40420 [Streptomyces sp. NPDC001093]
MPDEHLGDHPPRHRGVQHGRPRLCVALAAEEAEEFAASVHTGRRRAAAK